MPETKICSIDFFIHKLEDVVWKLYEKIDFEVWKSVIGEKSRLKILRTNTIELNRGADLQVAITSAKINIFQEIKSRC